jgi:hypothetical protein
VLLDEVLPDGRRIIAHYDAQARRFTRLTTGDNAQEPVFLPGGRRFVYLDISDRRRLKQCDLANPTNCQTVVDDPGASLVLGVSPSGKQVAYVARDGLEIRLRVAVANSPSRFDLGPVRVRCRVRWSDEERLWLFQWSANFQGWTEFDITRGRPTGRQEAISGAVGPADCPDPAPSGSPGRPKLRSRAEAELWKLADAGSSFRGRE